MDFSTRLRGINPTNTVFYSPQPRAEVYFLLMNFKISKLAYWRILFGLSLDELLMSLRKECKLRSSFNDINILETLKTNFP